jgi:hypothetical protein
MRKLFFLAGFFVSASLSDGATITDYAPTRDSYMRGGPTDLHGSDPSGRASKSFLDFYIADFDRTVIKGAIEAQLGHPLAIEDMPGIELSLNLFSNNSEGYQPTALSRPAVFQGTQDWVEGTSATAGATKGFALYDPANNANNQTWKNRSGADVAGFLNLDKVENVNFEEWGGTPDSYRKWVLDGDVAFAYLTDPLSLGLFLNASDGPNPGGEFAQYSNNETYSRDSLNPTVLPFLEVSVIPEPGPLSMLGLGALMLIRRRRG